ncbi:MAG: NAD(P)/FAD-dependent oxidoreductase [Rhodobacteraceae bacterium]|nr:NAD(P)/FAD-dependent oxidoreductase [Paracoccaceae bacterium]
MLVGAGFSEATLARKCAEAGLKVTMIEARSLARAALAAFCVGQRPPVFAREVELASLTNPS